MAKNRKTSKRMSVIATNTLSVGAVVMMLCVMMLVNILASSNCSRLMKAIGAQERELRKLEETRLRESARWDSLCTPENLEAVLVKNGMSMKFPKQSQIVHMGKNGRPVAGQLSVARLAGRSSAAETASASRPASRAVSRKGAARRH